MTTTSQNLLRRGHLHLLLEEPAPEDRDWYGNVTLHHAVVRDRIDLTEIKLLLEKYPEGAAVRNQFERIPLHGALDRSPGVCNEHLVQLLVAAYPAGVDAKDEDGLTPLDIAVHWNYPAAVMKPMLIIQPNQYRDLYCKVIYGKTLGAMINAAESVARSIRSIKSAAPIAACDEVSADIGHTAPPTRDEDDSARSAAGPETTEADLILNASYDLSINSNKIVYSGDSDELTWNDSLTNIIRCDSRLSVESFHSIVSAAATPREQLY